MGKKLYFLIIFGFLMLIAPAKHGYALDESAYNNSGLSIPRFVSLRSDKVFVRTGPAQRYPIKWVFKREGLPVEIIQEFDTWRKIRDLDGEEGWIHQSLLSGKRNIVIRPVDNDTVILQRDPEEGARAVVALEPKVIAQLIQCVASWCELKIAGYEGWTQRKMLWGIYEDEKFD